MSSRTVLRDSVLICKIKSEKYCNRFRDKSIDYIFEVFKTDSEPMNEFGKTGDVAQFGKTYYVRYPDQWELADMRLDDRNRPTQPHPTLGSCRWLDVGTMNWRLLTSWNTSGGEKQREGHISDSFQSTSTKLLKRKGLSHDTDIQEKKPRFEKNKGM